MKKFKTLSKIPRLHLETVSKFWEREFSIFTMSSWRLTFDILNRREYGNKSFNIFICFYIYQKGIATHFRSREEEDRFEMIIGEKIIQNPKFRKKIFKFHDFFGRRLLKLFKQIDETEKVSAMLVRNFSVIWGKFIVYNTCIQRAIDYLGKIEGKKIVQLLIRARVKYEKRIVGMYEIYLDKICEKIVKEKSSFNISSPDILKLLTLEEIINFMKTNKLPSDLIERKQICALIILPKPVLLVGKLATKLFKKLKQHDWGLNQTLLKGILLKGTPVYPAKIRGCVQVIKHLKKLKGFKKGDILVVPTTLPKYISTIIQAKGIITDEGGLLSHAAIVSREFKIPTIVGTKIATQKLKTGQIVELDAIRGIVKILKQ